MYLLYCSICTCSIIYLMSLFLLFWDRIQNGLSGAALGFFQREFTFFKKVTEISGIIRPFPKVERKAECLKALAKVQLEPGRTLVLENGRCVWSVPESGMESRTI